MLRWCGNVINHIPGYQRSTRLSRFQVHPHMTPSQDDKVAVGSSRNMKQNKKKEEQQEEEEEQEQW